MHIAEGAFRDYTLSSKVKSLVADLGWKNPVVPQSMHICKTRSFAPGFHLFVHGTTTVLFWALLVGLA